jgi:hypothetical protein
MPSLPVVAHDQIAACERGEHWIESLSVQRVRTHVDRTEGREILAAGGVIRYALDLPRMRRPRSSRRH